MSSIVNNLVEAVSKGNVYDCTDNIILMQMWGIVHDFIRMQEISPPTKENQFEAFGGSLYRMLVSFRIGYYGVTTHDWKFILDLCLKNQDVEYFVTCILQIVNTLFYMNKNSMDIQSILPNIYSLLVSLTKNFNIKNPAYWAFDLVQTWVSLFSQSINIRIQFCNDIILLESFLHVLTCTTRGNIVPSQSSMYKSIRFIEVRSGLQGIPGSCTEDICFHLVYISIFQNYMNFRKSANQFWPFLITDENKLAELKTCRKMILQMKKEENMPKNANNKRIFTVCMHEKSKKYKFN
jgi:hypothetical protein